MSELCRRQPSSRISLRRVVGLAGQHMGREESLGSMALPPRSYARADGCGTPRTVGIALLAPAQSWLDQHSADAKDTRSAVRRR